MRSIPRVRWLLALSACLAPSIAHAQINRPDHARRIVHLFDFEEPVVGTIRLPRHWVRAQHDPGVPRDRPGFPVWNAAELDDAVAFSGEVSVRVPIDGGSASLRLDPGVIPVFPGADYLIAAKVRTTGAKNARARLVARLLDGASAAIAGSEWSSELVRTQGEWVTIGVVAGAREEEGAFLQIDLEMVQSREYRRALLGEHEIFYDDHDAVAWFDDVVVMQLPRVELTTPAPCNLFVADEQPTIDVTVRDLTGRPLRGVMRVLDDRGNEVDAIELDVTPGRFRKEVTPRLPRLGWYRAILELFEDDAMVGSTRVDLAWLLGPSEVTTGEARPLGDDATGAGRLGGGSIDRERFGLVVDTLIPALADALPEFASRLGAGSVTLPAWEAETTPETADARAQLLSRLVSRLALDWIDVTVAFSRLPDALAEIVRLRESDAHALISSRDPASWRALTHPILDQLGPRVGRWRFGPVGDETAFWSADETLLPLDDLLTSTVTAPEIVIPWRADRAIRDLASPALGAQVSVSVLVPHAFDVEAIEALAPTLDETSTPLGVVIESLPGSIFGERASVDDFVRRTVVAWGTLDEATLRSLAIEQPWRRAGVLRSREEPLPAAPAWRNLVERLAERRTVGPFPGIEGVRCEILDQLPGSVRGGALVAWRVPGHVGEAVLEAPLGDGDVRVIDVYGNERTISPTHRPDGTIVHVVPVSESSVFIEDVDIDLVRFVAGFAMEPGFVESRNREHPVELVLANPWPTRITGALYIVQPGGDPPDGGAPDRSWQIHPRTIDFSIGPGETARFPVSIAFSPYAESGRFELVAEADVSADRQRSRVRLVAPFHIGLEHLALAASYRFAPTPAGPDLVIEATLTNTGDEDAFVELRAFPPGMARIKLPPAAITPGQAVTRTFVIESGASALQGETVSIHASEVDADGALNRRLTIE